jgi:hypothetical protein
MVARVIGPQTEFAGCVQVVSVAAASLPRSRRHDEHRQRCFLQCAVLVVVTAIRTDGRPRWQNVPVSHGDRV